MLYICNCGRTKSGQPYHSSAKKRWLCERCKVNAKDTRENAIVQSTLTTTTFQALSLSGSRDGIGRRTGLKIRKG